MKADDLVDITSLSAAQALAALREGRTSAEELVSGCLARIRADEPRVQAWAFVDETRALAGEPPRLPTPVPAGPVVEAVVQALQDGDFRPS